MTSPLEGRALVVLHKLEASLGCYEVATGREMFRLPTADLESLAPSKPDEDALGLTYDQIDDFLEGKKIDPEIEQRIIHIFLSTAHKREPIATVYDQ